MNQNNVAGHQTDTVESERELLLDQLDTLCTQQDDARDRARLVDFLRAYYASANLDILKSLPPPDLLTRGVAHWKLLQAHPDEQFLEIVELADSGRWLLRCVGPDMPFLVDSLLIALRRSGARLGWMVHPVLPLRWDQGQAVITADTDVTPRSLIQVEFSGVDSQVVESLHTSLHTTLRQLSAVVEDYPAMRARVAAEVEGMAAEVRGIASDERAEIGRLLQWLEADHFTFLGYRETHAGDSQSAEDSAACGLGLWRADEPEPIRIAPPEEMAKYASSRRPIVITTTEGRSPIHHDEYCDVVVIKRYDADGNPAGTARFLGLFASEVYNTLPRRIPLIGRKIEQVMLRAGLRAGGHAAKQLRDILDSLPRTELFESSVSELLTLAQGVQTVREAHNLRLFLRRDRYGRFYSCMIYQHRERYSSTTRRAMSDALMRLLGGHEVQHEVSFQRDGLARTHLLVRTPPGTATPLTVTELESRLQDLATRWEDALLAALKKLLPDVRAEQLLLRWGSSIPASYREDIRPLEAATDLQYLDMVEAPGDLRVRLVPAADNLLGLKLYGHGDMPSLSLVLPRLEQFGLKVQAQHPYRMGTTDKPGWIQHFDLAYTMTEFPSRERRSHFEEAFVAAWCGTLEHDGLNALVLSCGLPAREVALTRALVKYVQQSQLPFSQGYIEQMLLAHADFVAGLLELFRRRLAPGRDADETQSIIDDLQRQRDAVDSLDADRLLACLISVVCATVRTNFYQQSASGQPKAHISLKIRSRDVPELPRPRPMVETFVYAPEVEGVHLRGGPVARGGLRWSDRREDFRTEVLGLVKAQMVKNAVIVPQGAKGGFVLKSDVDRRDRAAWQEAGIAGYKTFIRGLLDITDNLVDGEVVPPRQVRRHDGDDPYLVVAADKGTATFSDIANGISEEYGFWLGDAFASGGSAGYDHKKMGITARGAWESVKRHFREQGRDCQREAFTVVGVGDMGGDVFGNGMLLSEHIRLLAAFNHIHIFLDPNPDAASSFAERQRLFAGPKSSWADYNTALISPGGGVFLRSAKSIPLSPEIRAALDIEAESLSPNALISAILRAPVDLLWSGGIGTYVKARSESHVEVGDRANDALRVNGDELRARVVGEGGNLGMTQLGRIEAARRGVRVITDFNDNAGGVNSSDREVNLKIPLNTLVRSGTLALDARNTLLESMTDELAAKVLEDSDQQTQGLCLQARSAPARLAEHAALVRTLEKHADLDRGLEHLPDEEGIAERRHAGQGLTMPELAVLVSYSKLDLFSATVGSDVPDDPYLEAELFGYFPRAVREQFPDALAGHRLRREIIATVTTNRVVNRMGVGFARRIADEHHLPIANVVKAWLGASAILDAEVRYAQMEEAGAPIDAIYAALDRLSGLLKRVTVWLLNEHAALPPLSALVDTYAAPLQSFEAGLEDWMRGPYAERHQRIAEDAVAAGFAVRQAGQHAHHHVLGAGLDITVLARRHDLPMEAISAIYFALGAELDMPWLLDQINALAVSNRWQAMARNQLREQAFRIHRAACDAVLRSDDAALPAADRLRQWQDQQQSARGMVASSLNELKALDVTDSAALTVMLGQMQRLVGM
ncbi:MAG: NAD-glutamate dehydrogenase [Oceanococcaceae bacterium]